MDIVEFEEDLEQPLLQHLNRHWSESGRDGPHFLPFDIANGPGPRGIDLSACALNLLEHGWQRWFLMLVEGTVRGHCSLKCDPLPTAMHRCELGVGIETAFRGTGSGTRLIGRTIAFAKSSTSIDWIDLRVLQSNSRAIDLYRRLGFHVVATVEDRVRIRGESIAEVLMSLRVK